MFLVLIMYQTEAKMYRKAIAANNLVMQVFMNDQVEFIY